MKRRVFTWSLALCVSIRGDAAARRRVSPSIDVLGSYFPAWLLCIVVGVALTVVTRLLFVAWKIDAHLLSRPIVYPCLTAVFAMTVWLLFFRN